MSRPSHRPECQRSSAAPAGGATPSESLPALLLEIRGDESQCVRQWVSGQRALIGSGAACEVRLEDREISPLHSLICWSEQGFQLEVITPFPPLRVNGERAECLLLADGDRIEIGPFEVVVRQALAGGNLGTSRALDSQGQPGETPRAESPPLRCEIDDVESEDLTNLSAADLVDRIEAEEEQVVEYEERRRAGVAALLEAVAGRAAAHRRAPGPQPIHAEGSPAAWFDELEGVLRQLTEYATELEQRADGISRKEASFAQAASAVLDSQQKLVSRLESILDQLLNLANTRSPGVRRAA